MQTITPQHHNRLHKSTWGYWYFYFYPGAPYAC
jgi:hypothetical protein